jgi:hypothetical protein
MLGRFELNVPTDKSGKPIPREANVLDVGGAVLEPFGNSLDTRSIAFLPSDDDGDGRADRSSALVVAQSPSSLIMADVSTDLAPTASGLALGRVVGSAEVGFGATRVATGVVNDIPIAVVTSFDSRELALVDLRTMAVRSVVPNLSGPYAVVLDQRRGLAFVTDFRSSVVRVLDVKPALEPEGSEPIEVLATLGRPRVLQELR